MVRCLITAGLTGDGFYRGLDSCLWHQGKKSYLICHSDQLSLTILVVIFSSIKHSQSGDSSVTDGGNWSNSLGAVLGEEENKNRCFCSWGLAALLLWTRQQLALPCVEPLPRAQSYLVTSAGSDIDVGGLWCRHLWFCYFQLLVVSVWNCNILLM